MKSNSESENKILNFCVREQRAAFRAMRTAIDDYFLQGKEGLMPAEELAGRLSDLLRYVRSVGCVVRLRGGVEEALGYEGDSEVVTPSVSVVEPAAALVSEPLTAQGIEVLKEPLQNGFSEERRAVSFQQSLPVEVAAERETDVAGGTRAIKERAADRFYLGEKLASAGGTVDMSVRRKPLKSLEKGMTVNDCLYFRQELCGGDHTEFKKLVASMDGAGTLEKALQLLNEYSGLDSESEVKKRFVALLERRYFCE